MRVFVKDRGGNRAESWVEDWLPNENDWIVVSQAKLLTTGKQSCFIDTIETSLKHRGKGYATAIIQELQKYFIKVAPIGVIPSSQVFWDRFGMIDALGEEK